MPTKIFIFALYFLIIVCLPAAAQKNNDNSWARLESGTELSVAVPNNFTSHTDTEGFFRGNQNNWREKYQYKDLRSVVVHENGVVISVERYQTTKNKRALDILLQGESFAPDARIEDVTLGNFVGKKVVQTSTASTLVSFYLASDNYIYFMAAGARSADAPNLTRFLNSIRVEGKKLVNTAAAQEDTTVKEAASFADLENMTLNISNEKASSTPASKPQISNGTGIGYGIGGGQGRPTDSSHRANSETPSDGSGRGAATAKNSEIQRIVVLRTVQASYTEMARKKNVTGTVRLRLTFGLNGAVTAVKVIEGLPYGLTEQAIKAARRLLFLPAIRGGEEIISTKIVEMGFNLY